MSCRVCGVPTFGPVCGACKGERPASTPAPDDATGFNVAPQRYSAHGRETIDRIRDGMIRHARGATPRELEADAERLFKVYCLTTALKYRDRAGLKGSAEEDLSKARWYEEMAASVDGAPDPRRYRPAFAPYSRQEPS